MKKKKMKDAGKEEKKCEEYKKNKEEYEEWRSEGKMKINED